MTAPQRVGRLHRADAHDEPEPPARLHRLEAHHDDEINHKAAEE
jgi:hypothetical protein